MSAKRVALVTDELLGYVLTGGIGTATSFLALALARMGHDVEVLYTGASRPDEGSKWLPLYGDAGVTIRHVPRGPEPVEPPYFARMRDVEAALVEAPPDVVIAQDLAAPAYTALRMRRLGLGFQGTVFVVFCHGGRRWITDTAQKVRVLANAHAVTVLEQASVELADLVVAPSRYLLDWMRGEGWRLPEALVVPHFTRWAATGEPPPPRQPRRNGRVERISFLGRLEDRKGLAPFLAGLNAVDPALLRDVELRFLGRATPSWTPERVENALSGRVRGALRTVSFETELDQDEVLERLEESGTLAVLPSLGESFGNGVRECLDHGIPFLASNAGAVPELVAREDWERVLFAPTAAGVEHALTRALRSGEALVPARTALDDEASWRSWEEVLARTPGATPARARKPSPLDVVVLHRGTSDALRRCLSALAAQSERGFTTTVVTPPVEHDAMLDDLPLSPRLVAAEDASIDALRAAGIRAGDAPWLLLLDARDRPEPTLVERLVRARETSEADVVTCGLRLSKGDERPAVHLFAGEPRGLGALSNGYGTVGLVRRALVSDTASHEAERDHAWPLLAGLSASGARIVSVPAPLVTTETAPGDAASDPVAALHAAQRLESALPDTLRSLARVAAGLQADADRRPVPASGPLLSRILRRLAGARARE